MGYIFHFLVFILQKKKSNNSDSKIERFSDEHRMQRLNRHFQIHFFNLVKKIWLSIILRYNNHFNLITS